MFPSNSKKKIIAIPLERNVNKRKTCPYNNFICTQASDVRFKNKVICSNNSVTTVTPQLKFVYALLTNCTS